MKKPTLKAPFPAFGGKSQISAEVWARFGNPRNYCEPFAFSAANLLKRPGGAGPIETINDLNAFVSNFWRAVQHDPEAVASHADWPVNEVDLHARHRWLVESHEAKNSLQSVRENPDAYDAKIAGWWCWGACCWIGSGWCDTPDARRPTLTENQGVHASVQKRMPTVEDAAGGGKGVNGAGTYSRQIPMLSGDGSSGRGVHSPSGHKKRPTITDGNGGRGGKGVNSIDERRPGLCFGNTTSGPGVLRQSSENHRPQLADAFARGRGVNSNDALSVCDARRQWLVEWMVALADRLRPVRVCCGHWSRICDSDSTLTRLGTTAVFLDPPYRKHLADGTKNRNSHIYANDRHQDVNSLCDEVQEWCLKWGSNPEIKIALCGLEGEYPEIDRAGWIKWSWKSHGGYGNRSERGKENAARERVWFNPACLSGATEPGLFSLDGDK